MNEKIILFSGGTGGHVIPSVNFGNFLIEQGFNCILVLDKRGKKFSNSFNGKIYVINSAHLSGNFIFKINSIINLIMGFIQSILIIGRFRPKKVITFGSYATFMPLFVILILKFFKKIDIHIHEQNSVIGKVNSFYLPFANKCFTNFDFTKNLNKKYLEKKIHVGLPNDNNYLIKNLETKGTFNKINIFIFGGSQGSAPLINKFISVLENIDPIHTSKIYLFIQAQQKLHIELSKKLKDLKIRFEIEEFYHNINEILSSINFAITRAGAGTINDLICHKIPSIIMPLPHSKDNHQYFNAKFLTDKSASILFDEKNFDIDINSKILIDMINDKNKRNNMISVLSKINLPDTNKLMLLNIK